MKQKKYKSLFFVSVAQQYSNNLGSFISPLSKVASQP